MAGRAMARAASSDGAGQEGDRRRMAWMAAAQAGDRAAYAALLRDCVPVVQAVALVSILAMLVALACYVVARVRRQARGIASDEEDDDNALWLDEYRAAYESGELTRKEFDRIKARLRQAMLERVERPANAPPDPETAPPTDLAAYLADRRKGPSDGVAKPAGAASDGSDPGRASTEPFRSDDRT